MIFTYEGTTIKLSINLAHISWHNIMQIKTLSLDLHKSSEYS